MYHHLSRSIFHAFLSLTIHPRFSLHEHHDTSSALFHRVTLCVSELKTSLYIVVLIANKRALHTKHWCSPPSRFSILTVTARPSSRSGQKRCPKNHRLGTMKRALRLSCALRPPDLSASSVPVPDLRRRSQAGSGD